MRNGNIEKLQKLLEKFWIWSQTSFDEYSIGKWNCNKEESDFGQWCEMIDLTSKLIAQNLHSEKILELILTVIALDNEAEQLKDLIEEIQNKEFIDAIVCKALNFDQSDARWQVVDLLGCLGNVDNTNMIILFLDDTNLYVVRRALLALDMVNNSQAMKHASKYLDSNDEYLRKVAQELIKKEDCL